MPLVGDPAVAALEFEIESPADPAWLNGHFRLHLRGEAVGNWDDLATVRGIAHWWRSLADDQTTQRWDERLAGLDDSAMFRLLDDAVYGGGEVFTWEDRIYGRFHIDQLGMSSFDLYRVLLIEPPDEGQKVIWQLREDPPRSAQLPARTLQDLGRRFVQLIDGSATG